MKKEKKNKIEMELLIDEETGKQINSPVAFKIPVYSVDDFGNEIISYKKEIKSREELLEKLSKCESSLNAFQISIEECQSEIDEIYEKLALIPE